MFRAAGYEVDYVTPRGQRPFVYGVSVDTSFRDQAWNAAQVSPGEAALGTRYNDRTTTEGQRLNKPRKLHTWLPPTPRPQHGEASREAFRQALFEGLREATQYAGIFIVGGAGAYMDYGGNTSVRPLIELLAALGRPVVAICYGVQVLIQATDPRTKVPLVWGRLVTGHSEQDDYTDGTTDVPVEGGYGPNYGSATITLEQMIKQYTGPLRWLHLQEWQPVHGGCRRSLHHRAHDARRISGGFAGPGADARGGAVAGEVCRRRGRPRSRTDRCRDSPQRRLSTLRVSSR